ncbi:MAG: EamA family transporter [Rhodoferax sp.]|nr:EamA family transporter [Rhodoferax sp.]
MQLSLSQLVLVSLTVLTMSAGQILFKLAARGMSGSSSWVSQIVLNRYLWVALLVYLSATALWVALLRQMPLHLAYPLVALAFFFVPVLGHWFLDEPLRWQSLLGALVIVLGVWISVGWE